MANKGAKYQMNNLVANLGGAVHVALYLNDPTSNNIGDEALAYTRQSVEFGTPVKDGNSTSVPSSNDVVFPGKAGGYGTITHVAILSAKTGGDLIYFASLSDPIRSKDNEKIEFPAGSLKVTED